MVTLKSEAEIKRIKAACAIVVKTFKLIRHHINPGITTQALDEIAEEFILSSGAKPAFKGYKGYPGSICASVNEEIVHGIPGKRRLNLGDIISIDVGVRFDGFYGDAAFTFAVGAINRDKHNLIKVAQQALMQGIKQARANNELYAISDAIQGCAERHGYSVVRKFVGHGIGLKMHEEPEIPNFRPANKGILLKPGMVLAIEPMVNMGAGEVEILNDGWTAVTRDRRPSAHFEHTIAVSRLGPVILTKW